MKKINKLYESSVNGLLPERQAQRMIQQYDEEQLVLEKRVAELESLAQQDEIKQVDASRFIALVRKYRDCEELTDAMLIRSRNLIFAFGKNAVAVAQTIPHLTAPEVIN